MVTVRFKYSDQNEYIFSQVFADFNQYDTWLRGMDNEVVVISLLRN